MNRTQDVNHVGFQFRLNSLQYKIKRLTKYLQWSPMKRLLQTVFYGHKKKPKCYSLILTPIIGKNWIIKREKV